LFGHADPVTVDRYQLGVRIATGAHGAVYRAHDPRLGRDVALKVIGADDRWEPEACARLAREAQTLAKLAHPNVVSVFDAGTFASDADGERFSVYVVMELVEGISLDVWLRAPHSQKQTLDVLVQAGRGLAAAHTSGIVHRDFKPANVLVDADGRARVADFGVAIPSGVSGEVGTAGTAAYLAPEQHDGTPGDPLSDQYAFSVTAFQALCGRLPFEGEDMSALAQAKRSAPDFPPRPSIPGAVRRVLERGLAADPGQRFRAMDDLLAALERARFQRRRIALWVTAAVAAAAIATFGLVRDPGLDAPCQGSSTARWETVWNDGRAAVVGSALEQTGLPYAERAATTVRGFMVAYGRRWTETRDAVCRDTARRPSERGASAFCLEQRLARLDGLLGALVDVPMEVMPQVAEAMERVPDPEACVLASASGARSVPDPALGRAWALLDAGDIEGARAIVATQRDDDVKWRYLDAHCHVRAGELDEAERKLDAVLHLAERVGDDETAVQVQLGLARVQIDTGRAERADATLQAVGARLEGVGRPSLRGLHAFTCGVLHYTRGDLRRALVAFESARDTWAVSEDTLPLRSLHARSAIGTVLAALGDDARAQTVLAAARDHALASLGPHHPATAQLEYNLSSAFVRALRPAEAHEAAVRAEEAFQTIHGSSHPDVALAMDNRAAADLLMGRSADALGVLEHTIAVYRRSSPERSDRLALALGHRAHALAHLGRLAAAERSAEEAIATLTRTYGPESPKLADAYLARAVVAALAGRPEQAATDYRRVDDLLATSVVDHPARPLVRAGMAVMLARAGRADDARQMLADAEEQLARALLAHGSSWAQARLTMAMAALSLGAHEDAARHASAAQRVWAATSDGMADLLLRALLVEAAAARAAGRNQATREALASAMELVDRSGPTVLVAEVLVAHAEAMGSESAMTRAGQVLDRIEADPEVREAVLSRPSCGPWLGESSPTDRAPGG